MPELLHGACHFETLPCREGLLRLLSLSFLHVYFHAGAAGGGVPELFGVLLIGENCAESSLGGLHESGLSLRASARSTSLSFFLNLCRDISVY